MTYSPRYKASERAGMIEDALVHIGSWLLSAVKAEPGWNELVLDIKPFSHQVFVRITESRDDQDYVGSIGPLKKDSAVIPEIEKLQHGAYDEREGTWFTATVVVTAKNWPNPEYEIGAAYNRQDEPQDWEGEGRLTGRDLRTHLAAFPRDENQIPSWASSRLGGRRLMQTDVDADSEGEFEKPNSYLSSTLEQAAGVRNDLNVINVLRAALGGEVLLDISDSDFVPLGHQKRGPQSVIRYRVLRLANGIRALCLYSSSQFVYEEYDRRGVDTEPVMMRDYATKIFQEFLTDETCDVIVVDPGTSHECFIEKPQVEWVLRTPYNDATKNALLAENMQILLASLVAPGAVLLMGVHSQEDSPVFVPVPQGQEPDTMLVFTSAAEIAALDPTLEARSASAFEVLKFAEQLNVKAVRINALKPSATLPIQQVRDLIALVDSAVAV